MAESRGRALLTRLVQGGLANVGLRAATLGLRFVLGFYVISFLGLEAAGVYGLAVGAVGIVPAALGWGFNYFLAREVVGLTPDVAAPLIRDRLRVTLLSLAVATAGLAVIWFALGFAITPTYLLILALLWLETIALDVYMPLIGLELAWQANLVVFMRSAAWVPVVIGLGVLHPSWRTLDAVLIGWITGHLLSLALLTAMLRRWPILQGLRGEGERLSLIARLRRSWFIYLSDLGLVGLSYLDRFIVKFVLGLAATGVYSFYWSITFALQTLVATAVVQVALPRMLRAFRAGPDEFRHALAAEMRKTLIYSGALAVLISVGVELIFALSPRKFPENRELLLLLLAAATARSCAELLNVAIASSGRDRTYAVTNVLGIVLTIGFNLLLLRTVGLAGAALGALLTALVLGLIRFAHIRRWLRDPPLATSNAS